MTDKEGVEIFNPEADGVEEGHKRWHAVAICMGYNELAKLGKTLGEKVYFRLSRDAAENHLIELGGSRILKQDGTVLEIATPDPMPWIRFGERDIKLMREAVAAYDAENENAGSQTQAGSMSTSTASQLKSFAAQVESLRQAIKQQAEDPGYHPERRNALLWVLVNLPKAEETPGALQLKSEEPK